MEKEEEQVRQSRDAQDVRQSRDLQLESVGDYSTEGMLDETGASECKSNECIYRLF